MARITVPPIQIYPDPENIKIIQELKDSGKHITGADRTRMLFFEIDVLNKLYAQILNEKTKSVQTIVKRHMMEEKRINRIKFEKENPGWDQDHCICTPFYPTQNDLTICPCGCEYGFCKFNKKWYTPEQIMELDEE